MNRIPEYARVYNTLYKRIMENEYAIGDYLPPEAILEKQFMVSRTTIRKAIEELAKAGLVEAKQGRGTIVLDYATTQNINHISSLSETLEKKGYQIALQKMSIDIILASARLARELSICQGTPLARVQRLLLADGKPIAIMKNYILEEKVPDIEAFSGKFTRLYKFLKAQYNIQMDTAKDHISAKNATFEEASMLEVPIGTALLYLDRVCFCGGKAIEADHCKILGDKYEFEVQMTI